MHALHHVGRHCGLELRQHGQGLVELLGEAVDFCLGCLQGGFQFRDILRKLRRPRHSFGDHPLLFLFELRLKMLDLVFELGTGLLGLLELRLKTLNRTLLLLNFLQGSLPLRNHRRLKPSDLRWGLLQLGTASDLLQFSESNNLSFCLIMLRLPFFSLLYHRLPRFACVAPPQLPRACGIPPVSFLGGLRPDLRGVRTTTFRGWTVAGRLGFELLLEVLDLGLELGTELRRPLQLRLQVLNCVQLLLSGLHSDAGGGRLPPSRRGCCRWCCSLRGHDGGQRGTQALRKLNQLIHDALSIELLPIVGSQATVWISTQLASEGPHSDKPQPLARKEWNRRQGRTQRA
eukprot:RCo014184